MKPASRYAIFVTCVVLLSACQMTSTQVAKPALLINSGVEVRQEISEAVIAMTGFSSVALADQDLTQSSELVIERKHQKTTGGDLIQGREWSLDCNELFVVTGPVLKPNLPKVQQGSFRLSIPEYYYKIFVDLYGPEYKAIAFIMPNKKIDDPIMNYVVSIDEIEKKTGIDFFSTLDDSLEERLEKKSIVEEWPASVQSTSAAAVPINFEKGQIGTAQVKYFFGETATVCGQVVATKYKINGKSDPTYINLDKKWPETVFTLMVFGKDRINFSYKPEEFLTDKKICVTGKVGEFNGTPQIIATDETQIQIME